MEEGLPPKHADPLGEIRRRAAKGHILFLPHAVDRKLQRKVEFLDVKRVLLKGQREEDRDRFVERHGVWSYAMRGTTVDGEVLRVVVCIQNLNLLVVTVYFIGKEP